MYAIDTVNGDKYRSRGGAMREECGEMLVPKQGCIEGGINLTPYDAVASTLSLSVCWASDVDRLTRLMT